MTNIVAADCFELKKARWQGEARRDKSRNEIAGEHTNGRVTYLASERRP
jgi:hypothetical protein